MTQSRKRRKNKIFDKLSSNKKEINLNPLLSVIVNLIPLFLIVLNLKAIVGVEQNHLPSAKYSSNLKAKSKKLVDVDLNILSNKTHVILRNHEGKVLKKKTFKKISKHKKDIIAFIVDADKSIGHLTINPIGKKVSFNEISQAIDVSNYKINDKRIFKNFSIGNIL